MCAAVLRHLRSLRLMRRDGGFIHDLLQEAEVSFDIHFIVMPEVQVPDTYDADLLLRVFDILRTSGCTSFPS